MRSMFKASLAALVASAAFTGPAAATELTGDLKITSDMSNPAPRAVMEGMVADFQALHPDLNIELTIVDREAWKTQIRNALSANPPDVVNWYAANRMKPYVDAGLFAGNGVPGPTNLVVDFDVTNPGFTTVSVIPEPSAVLLLGFGATILATRRR